ncbi:FMN-binding protein [Inconstantimicrobium mannanitabidum]|uniref:Uncharacterized protein n=1 Tax=Inconstantimicrobium mannanitabidum TaxID=1604901 RepID=A0ACB5RHP2_9CLOT|nr:FMN-binding protein [Clostridium sp. TW13]GKX68584.1 hypothetical protein rsdtw13_38420 [Clostridium sp. TW13]
MKKKIQTTQIFRHIVQIVLFFLLPGLYILTFSELKNIYKMIISGNFHFLQAFPALIEFTTVIFATILLGRFFCGWFCAFGTYNDWIHLISKNIFKINYKVDEQLDAALKYVKYIILIIILVVSWSFGSTIFSSTSPWDTFAQITDFSYVLSNLTLGLILLALITVGAIFIERFFCRYLCPLGAVFSIISRFSIFKIRKPNEKCGKCRICTTNCSMGLPLYKMQQVRGGECINCLKCTEVCPRKNTNANLLGEDVNSNLASTVALATMVGLYGGNKLGASVLTKAGIASTTISSNASTAKTYKDGTYTGTGTGFRGATTKVSVTVSGGKITKIETVSNGDTPDFYERAINTISGEIISAQSASVDTVSGATFSSNGIIEAVQNALSQAESGTSSNNATTSDNSNSTNGNNTTNSTATPKVPYKDGTYIGTGTGFRGATTEMSVTVSGGKITKVETVSNGDTPDFYQRAINTVSQEIISTQSTSVDTVSGATFSSNGIIEAVQNALSKAASGSTSSNSTTTNDSAASNNSSSESNTQTNEQASKTEDSTSTESNDNNTTTNNNTANSNTTKSTTDSTSTTKSSLKNGTYTGTGTGFRGGTTKISVTVSGGKITKIDTISSEDTPRFYNGAISTISDEIISTQTASVDTVSGATYSSNGIIEAVQNALSQAK